MKISSCCHVFLLMCQGQSGARQADMENKPEELQFCFATRDSIEALLAHKAWSHLAASCHGHVVGACTCVHMRTQAYLPDHNLFLPNRPASFPANTLMV